MMEIQLEEKKTLICGIQGSGKTYLAKALCRKKGLKCAVYTPHIEEWKKENVFIMKADDFIQDFPMACLSIKQRTAEKRVNMFIIDEADLLFKNCFDSSPEFRDLTINHRHYHLGIIAVSRRLHDIPARFYGMFENFCCFVIESPHVYKLLEQYYEGMGDMVKDLRLNEHKFILKRLGEPPVTVKV